MWCIVSETGGLLKNIHLLRYALPSSLRRTGMYASFLGISRALHLAVFDQHGENYFSTTFWIIPGTRYDKQFPVRMPSDAQSPVLITPAFFLQQSVLKGCDQKTRSAFCHWSYTGE